MIILKAQSGNREIHDNELELGKEMNQTEKTRAKLVKNSMLVENSYIFVVLPYDYTSIIMLHIRHHQTLNQDI